MKRLVFTGDRKFANFLVPQEVGAANMTTILGFSCLSRFLNVVTRAQV